MFKHFMIDLHRFMDRNTQLDNWNNYLHEVKLSQLLNIYTHALDMNDDETEPNY